MISKNKIHYPANQSTNVLVYSESGISRKDLETVLKDNLDSERYIVYSISEESLSKGAWRGTTALLVLAGSVARNETLLLKYFLSGGQILAFSSDLISIILPFYKTDNREEKVEVSFENSPRVKIKNNLISLEKYVKAADKYTGHEGHCIHIEIITREDANNFPTIKMTDSTNNGTVVFTSLLLESNCNEKFEEEKQTMKVRIEMIRKLLKEMGVHLKEKQNEPLKHTMGYFIGSNTIKEMLLKKWCSNEKLTLKVGYKDTTLQFLRQGEMSLQNPSKTFIPLHVDNNPENFSSEEYYRNLTTKSLGQLLIYADVVSTTMDFVQGPLTHGIAVVARQQLKGKGRGGNAWITPLGQAVISVQISQNVSPEFVSIIQHVSALAAVLALRRKPYEDLDIRIKWPNDIYYGRNVKIGGTIANAMCMRNDITVNVGTGVNIDNKLPTRCVNDIINEFNEKNNTDLPEISVEYFLAKYLSELEGILEYIFKDNNVERFLMNYYKFWLHTDEEVRVKTENSELQGVVVGVDTSGWLKVRTADSDITVMPDGNTFDMMSGLIAPKFNKGATK